MVYTKELIDEVIELYPDYPEIIKLAREGSGLLGRYLDDNALIAIPLNEILLATSLEELQKKARLYKRKVELYKKWHIQDPRKTKH
jgi:hypothetical protein